MPVVGVQRQRQFTLGRWKHFLFIITTITISERTIALIVSALTHRDRAHKKTQQYRERHLAWPAWIVAYSFLAAKVRHLFRSAKFFEENRLFLWFFARLIVLLQRKTTFYSFQTLNHHEDFKD